MWLTKNEKKILKLLIDNAKLSDTSIAQKLNISSQAVGRIRKKLEEEIIKKYSIELDLEKLGLKSLSLIDIHYNEKYEKEIKEKIPLCPKMIKIIKLTKGTHRYKILRLDFNLEECEKCSRGICELFEITNINTIPISNIIKNDLNPLLHKAIDELGTKTTKVEFNKLK
jgi:DNA-binding Lrp family transcriptional regulator